MTTRFDANSARKAPSIDYGTASRRAFLRRENERRLSTFTWREALDATVHALSVGILYGVGLFALFDALNRLLGGLL
jgi:hypothetical protein